MTPTAEAMSRQTAAPRVVEACHQTIDRTSTRLDDELSYIVADMATLARAIGAIADNPVCLGTRADVVIEGLDKRQISDVARLAMWIDDIAERALADLDGKATGPARETGNSGK